MNTRQPTKRIYFLATEETDSICARLSFQMHQTRNQTLATAMRSLAHTHALDPDLAEQFKSDPMVRKLP
jgi:hypothetical protein